MCSSLGSGGPTRVAEWKVWLYYVGKDDLVCEPLGVVVHTGRSPGGSNRKVK